MLDSETRVLTEELLEWFPLNLVKLRVSPAQIRALHLPRTAKVPPGNPFPDVQSIVSKVGASIAAAACRY